VILLKKLYLKTNIKIVIHSHCEILDLYGSKYKDCSVVGYEVM